MYGNPLDEIKPAGDKIVLGEPIRLFSFKPISITSLATLASNYLMIAGCLKTSASIQPFVTHATWVIWSPR